MTYRGDYDPIGFDQSVASTWPGYGTAALWGTALWAGATWGAAGGAYNPGDWWYVTGPGMINGVAVGIGDRVYPVGTGRLYGELDYGEAVYGGDVPAPPWPADANRVAWRATNNSAPAWDRPPPPYAGCPFILDGWRIVVEALYNPDPATRTYGMGTYGEGVYGSENGLGEQWVDITPAGFGLVIKRGGEDGSPVLDVDQLAADLRDLDASLFPMLVAAQTVDGVVRSPGLGTPIRVSVTDPAGNGYPLISGRIEAVTDEHDRGVRLISLDAFGFFSDLVTTIPMFDADEELASERIDRLAGLAGWSWGFVPYPASDPDLRRVEVIEQAAVREQVDRAAVSASWSITTDRFGRLWAREWPLVGTGTTIEVTDQKGASALPSPRLVYVADDGELLNVASVNSEEVQGAAEINYEIKDGVSIGRFGRSSETLGFPLTGLSAKRAGIDAIADAALARYSRVVNRCISVDADSALDPRWVEVLANLELGQRIRTIRTKPVPLELEHVLVGIEHRLTRDRWAATLFLTTVTPTT